MKRTLTDQEKAILFASMLRGRDPIAEIADTAGLPAHKVAYALRHLRADQKVFTVPLVNVFAIGLQQYTIYFSISAGTSKRHTKLFEFLEASPFVVWVGALDGLYDYGMTVSIGGLRSMVEFLDEVAAKFGAIFYKKVLLEVASFTFFRLRFLSDRPTREKPAFLSIYPPRESVPLDSTDRALLAALVQQGDSSNRQLAEITGVPRSTVDYRVRRLHDAGVIAGYVLGLISDGLGLSTYKILVVVRGLKRGFKEKLFAYCAEQLYTAEFVHCLGTWDFEIGLQVPDEAEAQRYRDGIQKAFPKNIQEMMVVRIYNSRISRRYLAAEG